MVYRLAIVSPPPPPFWMTKNHFRLHLSPFQINTQLLYLITKWLPVAILDDRKSLSIAFLAISDQYANFNIFFFTKWLPAAILDDRKITFDRISRHFRSIRNFYFLFICSQNGCRRPFWMTENHFWLHFSPFQINTQLLFFSQNGWPAAMLDDRKITFDFAFRTISDQYATFIFCHPPWRSHWGGGT